MRTSLQDVNIQHLDLLPSPQKLRDEIIFSKKAKEMVVRSRETIKGILNKKDLRLLAIVGPCSIHDSEAALEYAKRLQALQEKVKDTIFLVMRVYFEKPRTTVGWKGLINDPHLDNSFDVVGGIRKARQLLVDISELNLPIATELLDPIIPQYIANMISWTAIGARTTESQTHREMASGLSMPVGFKNGTDGNLQICIDAIQSVQKSHTFLGVNEEGQACVVQTAGNLWGHIVLRGGNQGPNYQENHINDAVEKLQSSKIDLGLMVDCSHANSNKDFNNQPIVWNDIINQKVKGQASLVGIMLESNLFEGNQKFVNKETLKRGISITDACVSWETTEELILSAHKKLQR